ncbi:D-serine deaminase, pyridoxal phosphate-dependent [Pseudomonas cedrina]|uniref:Alanine racemase n=2 Tax=Pseudomonas cedrina TaxID=651740 RepID=A0A1V2K1U4_PSECE|nr:alanine racemase [Pseudomonas cedrina]ONH51589.1 alanine racemase [Pseudomonas cedrina subsp. cedrina]SDT11557.1 D-serine deaminase, pyridoxal phosphate-dependent [Pseudomonas cedrina]
MSPMLETLNTPAALIDIARMQSNITRMQLQADQLGVRLRPHVKTSKCLQVVQAQIAAGAAGIAVSTLKEAETFFKEGISDILYAVAIAPSKLSKAWALRSAGCSLKIIIDSLVGAQAIVEFARSRDCSFDVYIEIDSDHHRSGVRSDAPALVEIASALHHGGIALLGVMTHAGESYKLNTPEALRAIAEVERRECVAAAEAIRAAGLPCPEVSVGSTPTALNAVDLNGVTELRAGVYVFFDLVMHNTGVCTLSELALSVLTTVIGHQREKGWIITDSGWMAMSRDRGTQSQTKDFGYGVVCTLEDEPVEGLLLRSANQEHGIASFDLPGIDVVSEYPIGTRLRILPNHACATGAQFPNYDAVHRDGSIEQWARLYGW